MQAVLTPPPLPGPLSFKDYLLWEYLVLSQDADEPAAWVYRRAEGWKMPEAIQSGEVELSSLGLWLSLEELYRS